MDLQHSGDTLANLFWDIDPVGEHSFQSIIEVLENADAEQAAKVADVVRHARRPDERTSTSMESFEGSAPGCLTAHARRQSLIDGGISRKKGGGARRHRRI